MHKNDLQQSKTFPERFTVDKFLGYITGQASYRIMDYVVPYNVMMIRRAVI
jgi:hypothetical protein